MKNRYIIKKINIVSHYLFSLASATKWLSSTAIRLFSSSSDEINAEEGFIKAQEKKQMPSLAKRGRGRPRKDPNAPKKSRFIPERKELGRRRSSGVIKNENTREECGINDGETRFLLTFKVLPENLQIIAKTLHPPTHNKFEEHRLVCKLLNEDCTIKQKEIFIPTFRKLPRLRTIREIEKDLKEQVM